MLFFGSFHSFHSIIIMHIFLSWHSYRRFIRAEFRFSSIVVIFTLLDGMVKSVFSPFVLKPRYDIVSSHFPLFFLGLLYVFIVASK